LPLSSIGPFRQVSNDSPVIANSKSLPMNNHKLSINLPILPAAIVDNRPTRSSTSSFRLPSTTATMLHSDMRQQLQLQQQQE
ncbi:unnamed protein product, partial [Schistosoma turkestanicum]